MTQRIQSRQDFVGREGRVSKTHPSGIENGVCNGCGPGHRGRLARTQGVLILARHVQHFNHGDLPEVENRIAAPFKTLHRTSLGVCLHVLLQSSGGRLNHIAVDLMLHTLGVDQHARIVSHDHFVHMHFARVGVDLHIGHPRRVGRAKARPFAVDVPCIGDALAL